MVDFDNVLLERSGDFATITMNNPAKRNALSLAHMRDLIAAFRQAADSDARGVVLAGNGKVFSAGHDFADVADRELADVRSL
ncbi:MAG: enoyl-CoA hydratase/isomerase family protein, partial [Actinomycetota bacterium]|nr:enoyl-CoA hydratase/isomerase family protein [Actinomycetota bacterium]